MRKTFIIATLMLFCFAGKSQSIVDICFIAVYNVKGESYYILKSDTLLLEKPNKKTKVPKYNYKMEITGYWTGHKLKFVPVKKPASHNNLPTRRS